MAFHLRNSRNLTHFREFEHLRNIIAGYGGGGAELLVGFGGQIRGGFRLRRDQGKQIVGGSMPVRFLLDSSTRSFIHRVDIQIPFVLPHSSSLGFVQESLPLIRFRPPASSKGETPLHRLNHFRFFFEDAVGLICSGSAAVETDAKSEAHLMEVHRVCKVIDETFAVDRNMEAVLNECGVNLSHDLVLSVLERYKLARKPAFRFFCWASTIPGFDHDPQTFNAMLGILGQSRQFETVQSLLNEMRDKGMLNIESFTICIRAFAAAKERRKAVGIIDLMKKCSFKVDAEVINCLLHSLCREKLGKEALLLFRKLEHKFTPDSRTYTILLSGWCRVRNLMEAGRIWNEMIDAGFHPDVIAHNTMIEGLIRGRKRSDAIKLFHVMKSKGPSPDVKTYTAIISDLCKRRDRRLMNEAVDYFNEMKSRGLKPDAAIYTRLLQGFGYLDELDAVYDVLADMDENGCIPDGHTYNALIKMMVNRRMPDDAVKIYERMIGSGVEPSIHTYNMIMKSYFVVKDYETGMRTWEEMKLKGCCADENSYTVLIGSLLRLGKWSEACRYLEEMIEKGMRAPQFGRKMEEFRGAEIDTLQILIEKMKYKGNTEVADVLSRWLDHNSSKGMFSAFGK